MKDKPKKHYGIILLAVIIVVELIYTTFVFAYKKQGVHSDEMWTYGSANSYYRPQMYVDNEGNPDNLNKWISGELLHDYITVQKGEQFSYGSVYSNLKGDLHPPLYYMLVHTVCSFFPEKFSFWYAYAINFMALIVTQIFLYKLVMLISKDKKPYIALLACLLYGGGVGALSTFIFLRMYAMAAALATANIYYQLRLFLSKDFDIKHNIFPIAFTGLLGLLSHNLFAFIMGLCTACICLWLLFNKKIKKMFIYGFSMLGVVGVFCAIFPYTIKQALWHETRGSDAGADSPLYAFSDMFEKLLGFVTQPLFGFRVKFIKLSPELSLVLTIIFFILILLAPVCILFRKKPIFSKAKDKLKKIPPFIKNNINKVNYPIIFLIVISIGYTASAAKIVDVYSMGEYVSRYVMPVFPIVCAFAVLTVKYLVGKIPKAGRFSAYITAVLTVAAIICSNIFDENIFLNKQYDDFVNLSQITKGQDCCVVIDRSWEMVMFQADLENCTNVKFALSKDFFDYSEKQAKLDETDNRSFYLLMCRGYSTKNEQTKALSSAEDYTFIDRKELPEILKKNPVVKSVKKIGSVKKQTSAYDVYKIN